MAQEFVSSTVVPKTLGELRHQQIAVKFVGGREVHGKLISSDQHMNLVLNGAIEYIRDPKDLSQRLTKPSSTSPTGTEDVTRELDFIVIRGPSISSFCPVEGYTDLENPWKQD